MEKEKKDISKIIHEISEKLIQRYNFITIAGKKQDDIYVYNDGVYEDFGKEIIKMQTEKMLGKICKIHYVNEVIQKIARQTYKKIEVLGNKNPWLICLNNGVLDIKNMKLLPHDSKYGFMNKIPIDYNVKAKYDKIENFMEELLYGEDIDVVQEWFGYNLFISYPVKKAMIFRGVTNTGKTQMINVLKEFVGVKNISIKSLHKLAEGKWQLAKLWNKYANIADELSSKDITDIEIFKAITGGSPIDAEFKFGDSFEFMNYSKLTFACNKIPYVNIEQDDEAYFNRWIVIDFDNKFEAGERDTKPEIWKELTTPEELSGILNWALIGLQRLLENKKFSYSKEYQEIKMIMLKENSVFGFIIDCCENDIGKWISKNDLYEEYIEYCKLKGKGVVGIKVFGKEVKNQLGYVIEGRDNSGTIEGWRNIRTKIVPIL